VKKSDRLGRVHALAKAEEQRLRTEFGATQIGLDANLQKLAELESYRHTYENEYQMQGELAPARWQDYQSFLQRLATAVDGQWQQVRDHEAVRDLHRNRWMVKRRKLDSLERVIDRMRTQEDRQQQRIEQKRSDDLVSSSYRRPVTEQDPE